jgi:phage terminase small subunit
MAEVVTTTPETDNEGKRGEERRKAFVVEYVKDFRAKDAALRAGYSENGVSQTAYNLLSRTDIQAEIRRLQNERAKRLNLEADYIVLQFHDVYVQAREMGNLSAAIKALEQLGKHLGIFEKDNRQKAPTPEDLEALRQRLRERGYDVDAVRARSDN